MIQYSNKYNGDIDSISISPFIVLDKYKNIVLIYMNVYDLPPRRPGVNTCPPPMHPHGGPCFDPFHEPCCEPPHHHCHQAPFQLINHYNKVCFKNYEEAVSKLKVKNLLPGEMAFAYYFDKTADYGINSIAAVGSIKLGGTNIIYDNADKVQQLMDKLQDTVSVNNEKFDSIKDKLDILDDISTKIDSIIKNDSSNSSTFNSPLDGIKADIEILKAVDSSITDRIDTIDTQVSQVSEYIETHEVFAQALDASVKKLREDMDNIGLDGKLNEIEQKITQAKQDIIAQTNTDHAVLKSDLEKQINDLSTNYSSSLDDLKTVVTEEIDNATIPLKTDIYDLQIKDKALDKRIDDIKQEAVSESKQYTNGKFEETTQDINTSLLNMKNDIHDLSDSITEMSTNATNTHNELKDYIDRIKSDVDVENNTFKTEVNSQINSQKQYLSDTIDGFKREYTVSTNETISTEVGKVQSNLNEFINTANTKYSELTSNISTINNNFSAYKTEIDGKVNDKIATLNTNIRNYVDTKLSDNRDHLDSIYARKDEVPKSISGGKGIVIENGIANLTIDDNGILTVGGKRYQLTQV